MNKRHIIIPDSHASPSFNNDRYDWLGEFLLDRQPDVVVNIGDHWDMASICTQDKQNTEYHERRYLKDVESGIEANDRLFRKLRKSKRKKTPKTIFCVGNHENRIDRLIKENRVVLEGVVSLDDLCIKDYYDVVNPFEGVYEQDGIAYAHYFTAGVMNRPIGGKNHARSLLINGHTSAICGHTHYRDYAEDVCFNGSRIQSVVVGCYFDYHMSYAQSNNKRFWRGVVELNEVNKGNFEVSWISLNELRKTYRYG